MDSMHSSIEPRLTRWKPAGDERNQKCFTEELTNQLFAVAAHNFSHAHFFRAVDGQCCGEVDKINCGNQNEHDTNNGH